MVNTGNRGWVIAAACVVPNTGLGVGLGLGLGLRLLRDRDNVPDWAPPDYVSIPVWICLYTCIGYASYLVWRDGGGFHGLAKYPLYIYLIQLIINWLYPPIYFGIKNVKWGFLDLVSLCVIAGLCGLMFYSINKTAGTLFIPYLVWLSFMTLLNYHIWQNNLKQYKQGSR